VFLIGLSRIYFSFLQLHSFVFDSYIDKEIISDVSIIAEPDIRDDSVRYIVSLKNENIDTKVMVVSDRFPLFEYGDKLKVKGRLELPQNFEKENGEIFDYKSFLLKDGIRFMMYRPEIEKIKDGSGFVYQILKFKKSNIENIREVIVEPNASFISGVMLGTKQSLGKDLLAMFQNVGLIHVVVLSGYNMTIIATGVLYLTSLFGKKNIGIILSLIFLILFSLMVGFGATILRALLMTSIALLAKYLGRPYQALRALFVATFFMLMRNPYLLLHDPSFQLSVMATFGLIVFSPLVDKFLFEKISWFRKNNNIREVVSSTFAVQIFLLPLLIKMSGIFSPVSFFVNIISLPFVTLVMFFGFLTSAFGFVSSVISLPFGILAYLSSQAILIIVEFANNLPFSVLALGNISYWFVFVCYALFGFLYFRITKQKHAL
jgi:competence protein ComEC